MQVGDESWKDSAKLVMDIYTQRTHGTYIEQKGNALIWQFRDADPEFGFLQSKELEEHLTEIMAPYPVQVSNWKFFQICVHLVIRELLFHDRSYAEVYCPTVISKFARPVFLRDCFWSML